MPSNVLVSGFIPQNVGAEFNELTFVIDGVVDINGTYIWSDDANYELNSIGSTFITDEAGSPWYFAAIGLQASTVVTHPWEVTEWVYSSVDYTLPLSAYENLTVTEIPDQNTFGLPADVVALITSRFGTVANFLRLRNQGQI